MDERIECPSCGHTVVLTAADPPHEVLVDDLEHTCAGCGTPFDIYIEWQPTFTVIQGGNSL